MEKIDIIMGTYQGEKYVSEQITSILGQTHQNIHLIIRDDQSVDQTPHLLKKWQEKHPDKITILPSDSRLGVKKNFSLLLQNTQANYVMFADQDDYWMPFKVEHTLAKMKENENSRISSQTPVLIHTDLSVVDHHLSLIHPSFIKYTGLNPDKCSILNRLIVQNVVTGCTMMLNRSLINLVGTIPNEALMHDWWIALVAAAFGKVDILREATIFYRQHGNNTLGAKKYSIFIYLKNIFKKNQSATEKIASLNQHTLQVKKFLDVFYSQLTLQQIKMLQVYLNLGQLNIIKSRYYLLKYQFFKNGFLRNLVLFLRTPRERVK